MSVDCQKTAYPVCPALGGSVAFFETAGKEVNVSFISNHTTIAIIKFKNYYKKKKCMPFCNLAQ